MYVLVSILYFCLNPIFLYHALPDVVFNKGGKSASAITSDLIYAESEQKQPAANEFCTCLMV